MSQRRWRIQGQTPPTGVQQTTTPDATRASARDASADAEAGVLAPGQIIAGRYRIGEPIGRGGMGAVYEALQLDLQRTVAIKVLTAEHARRKDVVARFEREARLAASIGHENIIGVIEVGSADGQAFIAMERLTGASLRDLLDHAPIGLDRLVALVDQLLAALQAAHEKGIVHRDVKPENVFVVPGEEHERVKVLDFGISKILSLHDENLSLTQTGTLVGTPLYMSPEQLVGLPNVDLRVDLYAVGVLLYRAIAGRFPYQAASLSALAVTVVTTQAPPLDRLVPSIHPALSALVEQALAKRPDDRFASARELRRALRSLPTGALNGVTRPLIEAPASPGLPAALLGQHRPLLSTLSPAPPAQDLTPAAMSSPAAAQGRRGRRWWLPATFGLMVGVAWLGTVLVRPLPPAVPATPAAPVTAPLAVRAAPPTPVPVPPPEPEPEPEPATVVAPDTIRVQVRAEPASARILINGEPWSNPVETRLTRVQGDTVRIEATAAGHVPMTMRPGRDRDIDLTLRLQKARGSRRPSRDPIKTRLE